MVENLQIDTPTLALIIASFSFVWHIFTYSRSGVRLRIDLTPNTVIYSGDPEKDLEFISVHKGDKTFIRLNISNVGGQPTTLQGVAIRGYKNRLSYIRNKPSYSAEVLVHDQYTPALPHPLGLGTTWATRITQTPVESTIEEHALKFVTLGIYYSSSLKPKMFRLPSLP